MLQDPAFDKIHIFEPNMEANTHKIETKRGNFLFEKSNSKK